MANFTTIDDPSAHFQVATWTGDGSTSDRNIANDGNSDLAPDFIWGACRTDVQAKMLFDSSRGFSTGDKELVSSYNNVAGDTSAYNTGAYGWLGPSITDGFVSNYGSVNNGYWNVSSRTYVAWQWKANGGTTASNSDGNITSTVQANTTAGFSIVTWTGDGSTSGKNVGHGLGAVPKLIISKDRGGASNLPGWYLYHPGIGNTHHIQFTTSASADSPTWGDTTPTSSVFSVGGEGAYIATNQSSTNYVAYVFAEKQGYSKIGTYKGNEQADGAFVYTGFKPALVISKNAGVVTNWRMLDNKRAGYNKDNNRLSPNTATGEDTDDQIDILSNGFKMITTDSEINSGYTHIYMAFAENPFVTSTGVPATAR